MGDDLLFSSAKSGEIDDLKSVLKLRTNPCRQDEFGISALMYASWNGHLECVDALVQKENLNGVNRKGKRISSLCLFSSKGYNALHLAAISMADPSKISKITLLLLQAGINFIARDKEGKTAYELAELNSNDAFLTAYNSIISNLEIDPMWQEFEVEDNSENPTRPTPIAREVTLMKRFEELRKVADRKPFKYLATVQEFSKECKDNLDRREVFKVTL